MVSPLPPRPPHHIAADEVAAWLRGSAIQRITFHHTRPEAAASIREHGVDIERSAPDLSWGKGFYSSSFGDRQYGDALLRVAVRLERPLVINDPLREAAIIDDLCATAGTADVRAAVLQAGHDGIVIHWDARDFWMVAYFAHQVKIVVERGRHRG